MFSSCQLPSWISNSRVLRCRAKIICMAPTCIYLIVLIWLSTLSISSFEPSIFLWIYASKDWSSFMSLDRVYSALLFKYYSITFFSFLTLYINWPILMLHRSILSSNAPSLIEVFPMFQFFQTNLLVLDFHHFHLFPMGWTLYLLNQKKMSSCLAELVIYI